MHRQFACCEQMPTAMTSKTSLAIARNFIFESANHRSSMCAVWRWWLQDSAKNDLTSDGDSISDWLEIVVEPITRIILNACNPNNPDIHMEHHNCDTASNYANLVLQVGILFMELNDVVKYPDRNRLLAVLKILMVIFNFEVCFRDYPFALSPICIVRQESGMFQFIRRVCKYRG